MVNDLEEIKKSLKSGLVKDCEFDCEISRLLEDIKFYLLSNAPKGISKVFDFFGTSGKIKFKNCKFKTSDFNATNAITSLRSVDAGKKFIFENCEFYDDSLNFCMIEVFDNLEFINCHCKNLQINISQIKDSITFTNCEFENEIKFSNSKINSMKFQNCKFYNKETDCENDEEDGDDEDQILNINSNETDFNSLSFISCEFDHMVFIMGAKIEKFDMQKCTIYKDLAFFKSEISLATIKKLKAYIVAFGESNAKKIEIKGISITGKIEFDKCEIDYMLLSTFSLPIVRMTDLAISDMIYFSDGGIGEFIGEDSKIKHMHFILVKIYKKPTLNNFIASKVTKLLDSTTIQDDDGNFYSFDMFKEN